MWKILFTSRAKDVKNDEQYDGKGLAFLTIQKVTNLVTNFNEQAIYVFRHY